MRTRCGLAHVTLMALSGCGGGGSADAAKKNDCQAAFAKGHDDEAAGTPTFDAFLPSVKRCAGLADWTAAAKAHGAGLDGQEAVFVDRTCSLADAATQALPICREVKGADG